MTDLQIAVIAVAFTIAGIAKGTVGTGLPPIAIGIMAFAVPLETAIAIMTVPTLATNIWQAGYGRNLFVLLRRFGVMAVVLVVTVLAVSTLGELGSPAMSTALGAMLALYAVIALVAWRPAVTRRAERWANPVVGVVTGIVTGTTGLSAVPFLPYMQSLDIDKDDLVQALGILFVFITAALALALVHQGSYDRANLASGFGAILPSALGMWIGQKLRGVMSAETFRRIFLFGLLAIGLHMARGLL